MYPNLFNIYKISEICAETMVFDLIENGGSEKLGKDFYLLKELTPSKREKYQNGEIDRKQAVEYAKQHFHLERAKQQEKELEQMKVIYNSPDVKELKIDIYNKKQASPCCVVKLDGISVETKNYYGGGYDKESTAVGDALNSFPCLLKLLYTRKEEFVSKNNFLNNDQIFNCNNGVVGALPEFSCARGLNPLLKALESLGFELVEEKYGKNEKHYLYKMKGID